MSFDGGRWGTGPSLTAVRAKHHSACRSSHAADDAGQLLWLIAATAGKLDQLASAIENGALLRSCGDRHASTAAVQQSLVPKIPKGAQHRANAPSSP